MAEIRDLIKSIKGKGRTIFMSSHLLGEVQEACDEVALLNHGELLLQGSVRDLSRGSGRSTFQATFLRPPTETELAALSGIAGIDEITPQGDGVFDLKISGGEEAQAAILEAMVRQGLRVTSFRPLGSPLEQLYLDRIKESDRI